MSLDHPHARTVYGSTDTTTEVDSGINIIPGQPKRVVTVVDAWIRSTGTADTCTSIDITDGTTAAVAFGVAALTDGTVVRAGAANTTATNLGVELLENTPIQIKTTGSAIGTATAIEWCVHYLVSSTAA